MHHHCKVLKSHHLKLQQLKYPSLAAAPDEAAAPGEAADPGLAAPGPSTTQGSAEASKLLHPLIFSCK